MLKALKEKVKLLKAELSVLLIAYKDSRTPFLPKLIIGITVGYMLSPIDLIPDFIPVLGLLDDLILVPLLIKLSIRLIPAEIMLDARHTFLRDPKVVKKANWVFGGVILIIWVVVLLSFTGWILAED